MTRLPLSLKYLLHQTGQVDHQFDKLPLLSGRSSANFLIQNLFIADVLINLWGTLGFDWRTTLQHVSRIDGFSIAEDFVHVLIMFRHKLKVAFCFVVTLNISPFSITSGPEFVFGCFVFFCDCSFYFCIAAQSCGLKHVLVYISRAVALQ